MARAIVSDVNIEGHVRYLMTLLEGDAWSELWSALGLPVLRFSDLGLLHDAPDDIVWQTCQLQEVVLITANRNHEGPDSLEEAIRTGVSPESLPVLTLADPNRALNSREYAERVVERLLDILLDINSYRGAGRLYLP